MRHTRLLARDALFNLLGQGAPLVAAFFAIPTLTRGLGPDRFGVLALAWVFLGYFSLFDFGLGRALTQSISERYGRGETEDIPAIVWTSLATMGVLGLVAAIAAGVSSPFMVTRALKIPLALQGETQRAFEVLAVSIPVLILTSGFRGLLEARQRFDLTNAIRAPLSLLMLLAPLAVLPFNHSLVPIMVLLLSIRTLAMLVHAYFVTRVIPGLLGHFVIRRAMLRPVLAMGSWMTVSNLLSALLVTVDRFVIGAAASLAAVTYYTAPYEAVTKMWLLPVAIATALFPEFAATFRRDPERGARLYRRGVVTLLLVLFPLTLIIVAGARVGLRLWLGPDFASHSTVVLQVIAAGVLVNSIAYVPFTMIQGVGRPDLTAKLQLAEILPFVGLLWVLIARFGIVGAAVAWTIRCTVDTAIVFYLGRRMLPPRHASLTPLAGACAIAAALLIAAAMAPSPIVRVAIVVIGVPAFTIGGAAWLLDREDQKAILARLPFRRISPAPAGD
ncbi:MAG TPA: flippase [Gemmatimonadaceae bacterium]|nr:flippase [Gemmatimonadaceae bacterium]